MGFNSFYNFRAYPLLVEANKTNKGYTIPIHQEYIETSLAISESKMIVVLKPIADKVTFANILTQWSEGQVDTDRVRNVKDSLGSRVSDTRSSKPRVIGDSTAAMLSLTAGHQRGDCEDPQWWWLTMELTEITPEECKMVGNYVLENTRRDLLNAGYAIPRDELRLVLAMPGGITEQVMPVMISCPYAARAMYIRYHGRMLDAGAGGLSRSTSAPPSARFLAMDVFGTESWTPSPSTLRRWLAYSLPPRMLHWTTQTLSRTAADQHSLQPHVSPNPRQAPPPAVEEGKVRASDTPWESPFAVATDQGDSVIDSA